MKYMSCAAYKAAETRNPHMMDFQIVSRRQVELGYKMRSFRESHNMSQRDLAFRCSCFGKPFNVKITNFDVSVYERFLRIPSQKKLEVLLKALNITMEDLDK